MPTPLPLTSQQEWLWKLLHCHPDWNCTVGHALRLQGTLNVAVLQRSLEEIVRRHQSLRTRIVVVEGVACQEMDEPRPYELAIVPVPGVSQAQRQSNSLRLVEEFVQTAVDIAVGPLWSALLLKLTDAEHWLVLATHRFAADCFSQDRVAEELWLLYEAFLQGRPSPLEPGPAQYADYAVWQVKTRQQWSGRHEAYWNGRLASARAIEWPVDNSVMDIPRGVVGSMNTSLGPKLSTGLMELARGTRTLAANAMLAVYVAVLCRWSGQQDFVVPVFIAGRQSEHKSVVGYFSHIVYLRIQLSAGESFHELLGRVSNEFYRALSHQDYGRTATQRPELLSGTFFQWLTWQPQTIAGAPAKAERHDRLEVERVPFREFGEGLTAIPPGMVDVEVSFFDTPEGIYASGVYRADRFTAGTMKRFMEDIEAAAQYFVRQPEARVIAA